mmetsp:Transcript_18098/g.31019  ORF Transcript_18098/g.31019 Transcript_18098/m.31019 type:complete len:97 (+) Transcript_18098:1459-1749(+)
MCFAVSVVYSVAVPAAVLFSIRRLGCFLAMLLRPPMPEPDPVFTILVQWLYSKVCVRPGIQHGKVIADLDLEHALVLEMVAAPMPELMPMQQPYCG